MTDPNDKLVELLQCSFHLRQTVDILERAVYEQKDYSRLTQLMDAQSQLEQMDEELRHHEQALAASERKLQSSSKNVAGSSTNTEVVYRGGEIRRESSQPNYRGLETTGLQVDIRPRMQYVPTSIYHLFEEDKLPLLECYIHTNSSRVRRLRVTAFIERYSAQAVKSVEVGNRQVEKLCLLPTLFSDSVSHISELTRASLNIKAEDLENGRVEEHLTRSIWLLAHNAVPLEVQDPETKERINLRNYLAAMVTPNQPEIQLFMKNVNDCHPAHQLTGYLDEFSNPPQKHAKNGGRRTP